MKLEAELNQLKEENARLADQEVDESRARVEM